MFHQYKVYITNHPEDSAYVGSVLEMPFVFQASSKEDCFKKLDFAKTMVDHFYKDFKINNEFITYLLMNVRNNPNLYIEEYTIIKYVTEKNTILLHVYFYETKQ